MPKLKVDPEFRDYIPTSHDDTELRASIKADGCLEAIVLWKDRNIIVDGYRRHRICEEEGIGYRTREIAFEDRAAVLRWMDLMALSHRTLTPDQASLIRGRYYNSTKLAQNRPEKPRKKGDQIDPLIPKKTAEKLSDELGVSAPTIKRDGAFAAAVAKLENEKIDPNIVEKISIGEAPSKRAIIAAANAETKKEARAILAGKPIIEVENESSIDAPPWAEFNVQVEAIADELNSVALRLNKIIGFNKERHSSNPYAYFLHHDGTVGTIRQVIKTLRDNLPAEACEKQPGFIPVRQMALHNRICAAV